jgi:hypothetical protein
MQPEATDGPARMDEFQPSAHGGCRKRSDTAERRCGLKFKVAGRIGRQMSIEASTMTERSLTHHRPTPRQARISLAIHTAAFLAVNTALAAVNLSSGDRLWFQWPLLGWGAGLAWHAWVVAAHVGLRGRAHPSNET